MLRKIGCERHELTGWRRLHEEIRNLFTSPDVLGMAKSRRMGLACQVARMGEMTNAYKVDFYGGRVVDMKMNLENVNGKL